MHIKKSTLVSVARLLFILGSTEMDLVNFTILQIARFWGYAASLKN